MRERTRRTLKDMAAALLLTGGALWMLWAMHQGIQRSQSRDCAAGIEEACE